MKVFFYPLVTSTLCYLLGIILNSYFPVPRLISVWIFIGALCITCLVYFLQKNKNLFSTLLILFTWLSLGIMKSNLNNDSTFNKHYSKINFTNKKIISLTIKEELKNTSTFKKYTANITSVDGKNSFGLILLYVRDSLPKFNVGDKILQHGIILDLPEVKNPKEFSYADYLKKQNIYGQIYIQKEYIKLGVDKNLNYYIDVLRQNLIHSFDIHQYKNSTQTFINAFLFGQRNEVSHKMNEEYTHAGVIHILAISGLHIAIIYGLLLYVYKLLNLGFKQRYFKLFISILFLWTFALITGLSASVIRSVTMFTIIAIAMTFDKNQNIYNAMIVSLLLLTIYNPNYIYDVGLQLSYLSVFIIIICNPLYKKLHFTRYKILHLVADLVSITLSAQLFLLPVILYYFHQFPTLFLIANIVVIPLSNIILYGLVLILVLNYIYPTLSIFLGRILEVLITWLNDYIGWIASSKYAVLTNIPFTKLLLFVSFIVLGFLLKSIFNINFKTIRHLLYAIILLQLTFLYTYNKKNKTNELIVWNTYKKTLISIEEPNKIKIYSDSLNLNITNLIQLDNFSKNLEENILKNFFFFNKNKIVVVDSDTFVPDINPDIIVLSNSPKINLERILNVTKPDIIVADASNYKSYIDLWRKTCRKKNIPFHSTYEMGYYIIK